MSASFRSLALRIIALITAAGLAAMAQQSASTQEAYRAWRAHHPELERDAARPDSNATAQMESASTDQAKYAAARKASMDALREEAAQRAQRVDSAGLSAPALDDTATVETVLAAISAANSASANAIASDPDKGLQPLKLALDRERAVLAALAAGIKDRKTLENDFTQAAGTAETARTNIRQKFGAVVNSFEQAGQGVAQQQIAWTEYYRLLGQGAKAIAARDSSPTTTALNSAGPRINNPAGSPSGAEANSTPRTGPPVPRSRYVGEWQYSLATPVFHGFEPESVSLQVDDETGQFRGTLAVRFKAGAGVPSDRSVRLNFSGPIQSTRNQVFPVETADGLKGNFEIIPGPAFNLLEVNFQTEVRAGKIASGNFILIKK